MTFKTFSIFVGLFFSFTASAQQAENLLKQAREQHDSKPITAKKIARQSYNLSTVIKDPVGRVKALNLLAYFAYAEQALTTGISLTDSAVMIGKRSGLDTLTGDALVMLGSLRIAQGRYDLALTPLQEALPFYHAKNTDARRAGTFLNIGFCERKLGRFSNASKFYLRAADIYRRLGEISSLADTYNALANCFSSLRNYNSSITYHRKALSLRITQKDSSSIAQSCNNLGYVFRLADRPDSAIRYLNRAYNIRRRESDSSHLVMPLQNLGAAWMRKDELQKAKRYIVRSLQIARQHHMEEELARGELDMAEVLLKEGKPDKAMILATRSAKTAARLKLPEQLLTANETRIGIALRQEKYKEAFSYDQQADRIRDSLLTAEKNKTINELEVAYRVKQHLRDIAALKQKNELEERQFIQAVAASSLLIILLALLLLNYRQKVKAGKKIQILHRELHHRVKNNLQILSGLFVMQMDSLSDEAAKAALRENESRLTSMNLVHHKLYREHSDTSIQMEDYLTDLVSHISDTFGIRDNSGLHLDIAPLQMEADKAVAIGLIINELLTNSFKYSFIRGAKYIALRLVKSAEDEVTLTLSDDGPAWPASSIKDQTSFGLKIVHLMARQLDTQLEEERPGYTSYRLTVKL